MDETGAIVVGWNRINQNWYYFRESGAMVTGMRWTGNGMYLFTNGGEMQTGKHSIGGKELEFLDSGKLLGGRKSLVGLCVNSEGNWQKVPEPFEYEKDEEDIELDFLVYQKNYKGLPTSDRIVINCGRCDATLYRNEISYESLQKIDFKKVKNRGKDWRKN